jgi:TetR/AcrR family transcriptional repressor of nem operon
MSPRDPAETRRRLLQAGFREFHRLGFAAASLERILEDAGVTKGALYHHFRSKRDLAYAVITDVLQGWIRDRWLRPLESATDPIAALQQLALWGERNVTERGLALGCPLQGMVEELSGVDEGFRVRLESVYEVWRGGLAQVLARAQELGQVRPDVDVEAAATFVVAAWQGSIGLAKAYQSAEILRSCRQNLGPYLETLKDSGAMQLTHR